MAQLIADRRDLDFVIWEQMNGEELLQFNAYKEFNKKTCDMILTEARKLAINEILPTLQESDEKGVVFENGSVQVAQCLHRVHKLLLKGNGGIFPCRPKWAGRVLRG